MTTTQITTDIGQSALALAAVFLLLVYLFFVHYRSGLFPCNFEVDSGNKLDPEFVRQNTSKKIDVGAATPALQQSAADSNYTTTSNKNDQSLNSETDPPTNSTETPSKSEDKWLEMEYRWRVETGVDFDDIGGMETLKQELRRDVLMPLVNKPEKASELGVDAPNILFHGPPGTGKTYMAKALATELGFPFAELSGADIQSKWINESSSKVQKLFQEALEVAEQDGGAVVFLDELDSVLKDRSGGANSHEEDDKVVNEFLNWLEKTGDHNVVFIGATNRLDSLDEAGIRSGRIDKKIYIGKPGFKARVEILHAQLDNRPHDVSQDEIKRIAEETDGLVAADLESIVQIAAKRVLARSGEAVKVEDLLHGIQDIRTQ